MPSSCLYHVTPTANVEKILKVGLHPRSGKWRGPHRSRVSDFEILRAVEILKRTPHKITVDGDGYGTIELRLGKEEALKLAKAGVHFAKLGNYAAEWPSTVFLATSKLAAYEVAYHFGVDGHHGGPLSLLAIERDLIPGQLSPDPYTYIAKNENGIRVKRKRHGSLMTDQAIPASAIVSCGDMPADLMADAEFRRWMGVFTNKNRKSCG